jgi:hypothetical protein
MKIVLSIIIFLLIFLFPNSVSAGGATFTNQFTQVAQADSRAIIIFDGKKEILLDSFTFNINPISHDNFVWVIPIPSKPEVEPIKDEVFLEFEKLTEKKINKDSFWERLIYFDIDEQVEQPSRIFARPVEIWKYDIVEPGNYEKLNDAVREMGYFIPKQGRADIRKYIDDEWYFVVAHVNAMHIQMQAFDSLTTTGAYTLPLKITFETDKPLYPLKLASISPDSDSEYAPLGYQYGSSSESVLGDSDEKIDDLLSEQSKNKFPSLPLDFVNLKVDLFVLADYKMTADGFSTAYANTHPSHELEFKDIHQKEYVSLEKKEMYLTRLFEYRPRSQVEDVYLGKAQDNRQVNVSSSLFWHVLKLIGAMVCIYLIISILVKLVSHLCKK